MENRKFYKKLAKELLEKIGSEATPTQVQRMRFLIAAYEVLESDPEAQLLLTGKCFMSQDGKNNTNIRDIKTEQLKSAN